MPKEYIERNGMSLRLRHSPLKTHVSDWVWDGVIDLLENQPAADVVEVVRCKNCKWAMELTESEKRIYTNDCVMCAQIHPDGLKMPVLLNDFCSYGERKLINECAML